MGDGSPAGMGIAVRLHMPGKLGSRVSFILAIGAMQGCGGSTSSIEPSGRTQESPAAANEESPAAPDQDPPDTVGSACATSSQCGTGLFCSGTGRCIRSCSVDADCPMADYPVCLPFWEGGTYCGECRVGDSSTCPSGSFCINSTGPNVSRNHCVVADCEHDRQGVGCTACLNEQAELCLGADSACQPAADDLGACLEDYPNEYGPCSSVPNQIHARPACLSDVCTELANALDTCLYTCDAALAACAP